MKKASLRVRITLYFTLFAFFLIGVAFIMISGISYQNIKSMQKQLLVSTLQEETKNIKEKKGELKLKKRFASYNNGVYISVFDKNGDLQFGLLPYEDIEEPFENETVRVINLEGKDWFCYDLYYDVEDYGEVWFRGLIPVEVLDSSFSVVLPIGIVSILLMAVVMALGGYWLVTKALQPVREITRQAKQINSGEDLSKRIGIKNDRKDEICELAETYDAMLERLENAFAQERQFTSDVSHELRTPLTVILSQCEYALSQPQTEQEYQQALETVSKIAQTMSAMVSSLLQISRAEQGRLQMTVEEVNVSELLELVALQLEELAEERKITIHRNILEEVYIQGDETLLLRIFYNLMENGIKYGKDGGNLWITLARENGKVRITIRDDGIGISEENLPKIWQRFYQVDQAKTWNTNGAGLGLAMVKYMVQMHKGKVWAESKLGEGTTFSVEFLVTLLDN